MIGRDKEAKVGKVEGTMYFYAPEMCDDKVDDEFDAFPLDIWALGVTTFALVYLRLPFTGSKNNYEELISNIISMEVEFPKERQISDELTELIRQMLIKDPKKRITIRGLKKSKWLFETKLDNRKASFHQEPIKVTDEEIEKSLDFFISNAKNRNYELIWKPRAKLIKASNSLMMASTLKSSNSINLNSNKSLNSKHSFITDSKRGINLGRFNSVHEASDNSYFRSGKSIGIMKQVNEDDFFDN